MYYLFPDTSAHLTLVCQWVWVFSVDDDHHCSKQRLQMVLVLSRQLGVDAIKQFIQSGPDLTTNTMHVHCWRLYSTYDSVWYVLKYLHVECITPGMEVLIHAVQWEAQGPSRQMSIWHHVAEAQV